MRVYDLFWMTWSRPDDTEIGPENEPGKHNVHLGHSTLTVSLQKLITTIVDYYGC